MKITIISNGALKIVLCPDPENFIDREALKQLKGKTLTVKSYDQPTQILDTPAPDAVVLSIASDMPVREESKVIEVDVLFSPEDTYIDTIQVTNGKSATDKILSAIQIFLGEPTATLSSLKEGRAIIDRPNGEVYLVRAHRTIVK
jgi:hypothetical protein